MLSWNARGLGHPLAIRSTSSLIQVNAEKGMYIARKWGFDKGNGVDCKGQSGGLLVFLDKSIHVNIVYLNKNLITAYVTIPTTFG